MYRSVYGEYFRLDERMSFSGYAKANVYLGGSSALDGSQAERDLG